MPTAIIPHIVLLLRELLRTPQAQRAIKIDQRGHEYALVNIPGVGEVPAVVALRLDFVKCDGHRHYWLPSAAPFAQKLLQRMFPLDASEDNAPTKTLKELLKAIAVLEPPVGTVIHGTLAFNKTGEPEWSWAVSTIEPAERKRTAVIRNNALLLASSPWGTKWFVRRWRLKPIPDLVEDVWTKANFSQVELAVCMHLLPLLQSLWKAVFSNDADVRAALMAAQYEMGRIGQTRLDEAEFRQVVQAALRRNLTVITQFGIPPGK